MKENLCIKLDRTLIRMCRESRGRDAPRLARAALPLAALLRSCVLEIVVFGLGFHHDSGDSELLTAARACSEGLRYLSESI